MKNLDLNAYGVEEMDAVEIREVDGGEGSILARTLGFICGVVGRCITEMGESYANNPYSSPLR